MKRVKVIERKIYWKGEELKGEMKESIREKNSCTRWERERGGGEKKRKITEKKKGLVPECLRGCLLF